MAYATIKRGKVRMSTKSKQFRFLMWKHEPLSIVKVRHGKKVIKRMNTR